MKKLRIKLGYAFFSILFFSCQKNESGTLRLNANNVSRADFITTAQVSMKQKMKSKDFHDLDWANPIVQSLDDRNQNCLMRIKSKTDDTRALFYSLLDNKETYYLVSIHLPKNVKNENNVNGSIEVYTEKNKSLWKFIIKKNKVKTIENYTSNDDSSFSTEKKAPDPNCPDCTLPPAMVMGYISSNPASFYSLFYTYGGGIGANFTQTTPGQYGSGGQYGSPYYDKYISDVDEIARKNIFVDMNPNFSDRYYLAEVTKYDTYTTYKVVDNKSFLYFNVEVNFQLDKNNHLIFDKTTVDLQGLIPGTYVMQTNQNPAPIYNTGTMAFTINGKYSYGVGSFNLPIYVNVKGIGSSGIWVKFRYGNF